MAGLFDNIFGSAGGMYADMLSPEQQAAIRRQSMMQMAAKLLEGSGPSPVRRTLGQNLGSALGAGAEAVQSGQTNAVQQMLLKQKMDEAKDARAAAENIRGIFTPPAAQPTAPLSAQQALIAGGAGRVGPTPQRQNLMTPGAAMPTSSTGMSMANAGMPAAPMGLREFAASLPLAEQQSLQAMAQTDPNGALKALNERFMTASSFGKPEFFVRNGQPVAIQYNPLGEGRTVQGVQPYEALPTDIRGTEYIYGQPLAGTGQSGMTRLGSYGTATKPPSVVLPPGPNQFVQGAGSAAATRLEASTAAASSANSTLQTIDRIAPALDKAVLGAGADYQTTMLRVADKLGIGGPDNAARLSNTRQVVQGLAQAELDAASAMRGQGALSDSERGLLRRAAIGDQTMTAGELTTAMAAMQKVARQRLQDQQALVQRAGGIQGFEQIAPMYQITPYQSQFDLGGSLNTGANRGLGNAVQQEIDRRRGSGGAR